MIRYFLVLVLVTLGLSLGGWWLARWVNYSFMYRDLVIETIKDTVKSECLKQ